MTSDLISRSALLEELSSLTITITGLRAGKGVLRECLIEYRKTILRIVNEASAVDAVNREVFEQIMWERDTAMEQLKEHGIPFGGIAPDVVEVVRCKDCKRRGDPDKCPMCYEVPVYQCNGEDSDGELCWDVWEEIEDRTIDDSFCSCGERRADDDQA